MSSGEEGCKSLRLALAVTESGDMGLPHPVVKYISTQSRRELHAPAGFSRPYALGLPSPPPSPLFGIFLPSVPGMLSPGRSVRPVLSFVPSVTWEEAPPVDEEPPEEVVSLVPPSRLPQPASTNIIEAAASPRIHLLFIFYRSFSVPIQFCDAKGRRPFPGVATWPAPPSRPSGG